MNPIVIAYPRSGSEVLTNIIFNYASQVWNSKRCLQEFLLITFFRKDNFKFENNEIIGNYWTIPKNEWKLNWDELKNDIESKVNQRIEWLEKNPNYVVKLITTPKLTNKQYKKCLEKFNCIFIERRDNTRSFLSYFFLPYIGLHHEILSSEIKKNEHRIEFNLDIANLWLFNYKKYIELKELSINKNVLIYEDILTENNVDEIKILNLLKWPIPKDYVPYTHTTRPTPYEDDNLLEYFTNKDDALEFISQYKDIFKTPNNIFKN